MVKDYRFLRALFNGLIQAACVGAMVATGGYAFAAALFTFNVVFILTTWSDE